MRHNQMKECGSAEMADSLRASQPGLALVDRARRKKGWTKTMTVAWWEAALTSRATLKRFWRQAPIQRETFIQICHVVGISDWAAIAAATPLPPEAATPPNQGIVPDISGFYGRSTELQQLEQWSLVDNCRLIVLLGKPGIGKTELAAVFLDHVQNVQNAFTVIRRQSLRSPVPLAELLTTLLQELPTPEGAAGQDLISQFMAVMSQFRCLLIFDGMESILQQGSLAGQYQAGYEDYGDWLQRLGSERHQSCVIVISREQLREIIALERRLPSVRSLALGGLAIADAKQLLQANGLTDPTAWDALLQQYGTAPQILTLISATIVDLFNGSVARFLQQIGTLIIPPGVEDLLRQQFSRLSEPEQTVLQQLANVDHALAFADLQNLAAIPKATLPAVLESLQRRSLLERRIDTESGDVLFTLQPVIQKFIQRYYPLT
jgi:predicted ATPase